MSYADTITLNLHGIEFSVYECVETIARTRKSGKMGTYHEIDAKFARIETCGLCFIVSREVGFWRVAFGPMAGMADTILSATRNALDGFDPSRCLVSRNYPV